jgi:hypothetical protein
MNTQLQPGVLYFFFDDKYEKHKSPQSLLRGLIHQLICSNPSFIRHAISRYTTQGIQMIESVESLWSIFTDIATDDEIKNGLYVVIDALDECEPSSTKILLQYFQHFLQTLNHTFINQTFLKVIITSRPHYKIADLMDYGPFSSIRLKAEAGNHINADLHDFISDKVEELRNRCR